ncbi:MAG: Type IV fimbrial assembly, ATPase PilB [uncultured Thiotrichaceae bacterium]|uniref:Type IV fimbrial assembly, ATPase PilB n=1 Tax=uncultured Thiotrichaceae bacterium TaxID=298394 RepID=A0A6S6U144_9GAMM|nr:MAG: Type IV fimbrial assembly, ATPase PilB [uncultured Thiotrichaceae bacterium]
MLVADTVVFPSLIKRLLDNGHLTHDKATEAVKEANAEGTPIVTYLLQARMVDQQVIAHTCSIEYGLNMADIDAIEITEEVRDVLSIDKARKLQLLPIFKLGKGVHVGVADPHYLSNLDDIKFATGLVAEPVIIEYSKLQALLRNNTGGDTGDAERMGMTVGNQATEQNLTLDIYELESDAEKEEENDDTGIDITKFVNELLTHAIQKGVSDIHIEPYEKLLRVRYRIDGILQVIATPPKKISRKLSARIKVMSKLNTSERRVPQDGRIHFRVGEDRFIDFRVNTLPTLYGEKIVMRILDSSSASLGVDMLGFEPEQKEALLDALKKPDGMILVTGPTGSGKTVTLYTGLNILNTSETNIATAEDPSEIQLPGINQVNVDPKVGLTFASALKAFLRQDPDIIMVGEIRDLETADIAIKAAQTGHLVLSTLHTNSAPETLTRLMNMGVKPFNIASTIHLIVAQRLARRLCPKCKQQAKYPDNALLQLGFKREELQDLVIYDPVGCNHCSNGYKGRVGIYQVMPISTDMGRLVMDGRNAMDIADQAQKEGISDLRQSALTKARNGLISLQELERVTKD